ncbi:Transglycosylase SLT domain-containing protein [Thermodesulfobium acidiphilum]|uniref:Transglycosylase SLT domain-containing protein n=1 Tax=Thermodesulfobium acidiphilum TaxID=1794699 RepID=A0A2R4W0I3_THEAF|nr:transglycosylase SLT domain-containing protein [Thermodesulfobium acidiphilum]AWB10262.1 Transglycosylase SLT domain-containing protein [Thermodesulfobium acidiphilum]
MGLNLNRKMIRCILFTFFLISSIFNSSLSYASSENFGMWQNIKIQTYNYNVFPPKSLFAFLLKNNVPYDRAVEMVGIAGAESNYNPNAIVDNPKGGILLSSGRISLPEYSVGLFQINLLAHSKTLCKTFSVCDWDDQVSWLLDPYNNAEFAIYISGKGQNFSPWSSYRNGKYLMYAEQFYKTYSLSER